MIRNNLAILMSERGMKNSVLSTRTGISKNTISSTAQNDGKMIQLETINKLCQALGITPEAFFSYIPFDIDIEISINDMKVNFFKNDAYEIDKILLSNLDLDLILIKKQNRNIISTIAFETTSYTEINLLSSLNFSITLETTDDVNELMNALPTPFLADIQKQIHTKIEDDIKKDLTQRAENTPFENDMINCINEIKILPYIFDLEMGLPY